MARRPTSRNMLGKDNGKKVSSHYASIGAEFVEEKLQFIQHSLSVINSRRQHLDLNIEVSEHNLKIKDLRSTSLFWVEKLLIVVNSCQLYALEWLISQGWAWPFNWLAYSRFMCVFNLDFFSMSKTGAGMAQSNGPYSVYGEMKGYKKIALGYAFAPFCLLILYKILTMFSVHQHPGDWHSSRLIKNNMKGCMIYMLMIGHCPVTLAVLRFTVCHEGNVTVDPELGCGMANQAGIGTLTVGMWAIYTAILLYHFLWLRVRKLLVYDHSLDHERFLQRNELEYMLFLSDDWLVSHMATMTSFNRKGLYTYLCNTVEKMLIVFSYLYMRSSKQSQSIVFWIIFVVFSGYQLILTRGGPYRCWSSNLLNTICRITLLFDYTLGMLTGWGVHSSMLVASNQSKWLFAINGLGVLLLLTTVVMVFAKGDTWPTYRTLQVVFQELPEARGWVDLVRSTREFLMDCATYPPELVPIETIEAHMHVLRDCWLQAKSNSSILEATLRECLDECALAHEQYRPLSLLPAHTLSKELKSATEALVSRRSQQALMKPQTKRILMKLLAVRAFQGARKLEPMDERPERPKEIQLAAIGLYEEEPLDIVLLVEETANVCNCAEFKHAKENFAAQEKCEDVLRNLIGRWRSCIRTWEHDFHEKYGRKPRKEEKEQKRMYYENYRSLRSMLDGLLGAKMDFDVELGLRSEEGLSNLTEKLLGQLPDMYGDIEKIRVVDAVTKSWKRALRKWEKDFENQNSRKPSHQDKKRRRSWYENYSKMTDVLATLQKQQGFNVS